MEEMDEVLVDHSDNVCIGFNILFGFIILTSITGVAFKQTFALARLIDLVVSQQH